MFTLMHQVQTSAGSTCKDKFCKFQLSIDHDQMQYMCTMSLRGGILPYKLGYLHCSMYSPKLKGIASGFVVYRSQSCCFFFSSSSIFFQQTDQNSQSSNALRNYPRSHFIKPPAQEGLGDAAHGGYKIEWSLA